MISTAQVYKEWKAGAPVESLVPAGADVDYWLRILRRLDANGGPQPPKKRRARSRQGRLRQAQPSRKVNYAAAVIGRAMCELVERVNRRGEDDAQPTRWAVGREPWMVGSEQLSVGGGQFEWEAGDDELI